MVSQFLCLFATLFPILNHSSQSPSEKRESNQQIRRACSVGSISVALASGIVQAQTLPAPPTENWFVAESPLQDAIATDSDLLPSTPVDTSQASELKTEARDGDTPEAVANSEAVETSEASETVEASESVETVDAPEIETDDSEALLAQAVPAESGELKVSAASVPAERYRSVQASDSSSQVSIQPSSQTSDDEQALIDQMSAGPAEETAGPVSQSEAAADETLASSSSASQPLSEAQEDSVQSFQAPAANSTSMSARPALAPSAAQPVQSAGLQLPAPPQPHTAARPSFPSATLVADKDLQTNLQIPSSAVAAAPRSTPRPQTHSLPAVQAASPYPGHEQPKVISQQVTYPAPAFVQPPPLQPALQAQIQPGYASGYPQPYPAAGAPTYAMPYPATAVPYGAQSYPVAYPPQVYPQGTPGHPGYAVPIAQPYYYVAYPAPGVMGMPMYVAPPAGAPGGYPAPGYAVAPHSPAYAAPGYPSPYGAPGYPVAGGYPAPYPAAQYPAMPGAPMALPAAPYQNPYANSGIAATPPLLMPSPPAGYGGSLAGGLNLGGSSTIGSAPRTLPLPPTANGQMGLGAATPPELAPATPPFNLPVAPTPSPTAPSAPATPPLDPNPVLATPDGSVPAIASEAQPAVGGPLDSPTPSPTPVIGETPTLPTAPNPQIQQASLPQRQPGQLLRSSALGKPEYSLQGVFISEGAESAGRARLSSTYPLTSNLLFGGSFDVSSGDIFSVGETSGFSVNELYAATSIQQVPNLRFLVGQLDLSSYFDRNSFAKDSSTHFFNSAFQTNPALSAAGLASRTGLLMNWSATDNIELKAAAFSSDSGLGGFGLDGFAGEVGFRYGNAIIRGTFASDRDSGNEDGFREIFAAPRSGGGTGLRSDDREQAYGVNAEWYIPNLSMGVFGRYGRYENLDLDEGGDTFSVGMSFQDVFSPDDRLGLAYGQNLSNDGLRRKLGIDPSQDVLELFYDFRFLSNLRLGFSLQGRDKLSEAAAGFRLKAEFDTKPSGNLQEVR